MKVHKIIAVVFLLVALVLGIYFYRGLEMPLRFEYYFSREFINQLGPLTICVELLVAGIYLFLKHKKANFTLALYGFTALLDPVFNVFGIFSSNVPAFASIVFIICAIPALWIAFTNSFNLGKISFPSAFGSFVIGVAIELFFNYW